MKILQAAQDIPDREFDLNHPGSFKQMTKEQRRLYLRFRRAQKNQTCACGNAMSMMKWGEPCCAKCDAIERQQDQHESRRERAKNRHTMEYRLCLSTREVISVL